LESKELIAVRRNKESQGKRAYLYYYSHKN
jgi:hypothetical protein